MSNYIKYFTRNALYFTAYLIITGTVIQTFLLELGIRESNVSVFVTVMSLTNVISTILFSSIADNSTKIINTMSKLFFIIGLTFITFIPLCLISNLNAFVIFLLILIIGILQTLFIAIRNVFEYKLPYLIIPMENFNILMGVDGVISGIAGIVFSLCMVFFINKYPYFNVMFCIFIIGALLMFAAALINNSLKKMGTYEVETKPSVKFDKNNIINLFKNPIFKSFIIPNFTRGITAGIIGIVAIIGFHDNILDKVSAAYLVTAATVANIAGSILYTVLSKLIKSNILCLLGSIMTLALLFLSSNSIIIYIAGYFIAYLGIMIISLAIPYRVYEIIPFEIAGIYNSWRMILMTAGITFSTVATGFAIKFVPSYVIFIIAIVCQLYCGIIYFLYNKKHL